MCALTLSASVPALRPADCIGSVCPSATVAQYTVFFFGLYLVALGMGGIKPCVAPFGADQFDDTDLKERVKKGSFFNWYYFSIYLGILISSTFLVWIQDNVGWGLGFGVVYGHCCCWFPFWYTPLQISDAKGKPYYKSVPSFGCGMP